MKKRWTVYSFVIIFVFCLTAVFFLKSGEAKISLEKKAKLGTSYQISKKNAKFSSSDTSVAYVDNEGRVTTKSIGEAVIRIKTEDKTWNQHLTVVANGKKTRGIDVSTGEVSVCSSRITYKTPTATGGALEVAGTPVPTAMPALAPKLQFTISVKLKNMAEEDATKVVLYGKVGNETCKLNFGEMEAGEVKTVQLSEIAKEGAITKGDELRLIKLAVYSNKMYTVYRYEEQTTTYHYGTKDKKAPVISGFVGKNSYNQKMPYMVVYSNDKNYNYFQYVTAEDDREGKVKLSVNTKKVNFKKSGVYQITYRAVDKAGNVAKRKARIEVRKAKNLDSYADEVLSEITKPNWSLYKKATAIYNYTRKHISYTGSSNKSNWEKEAVRGLRYGTGDCFTYYAVARALLTRAGIPNIEVTRYRGEGHHWWNMVYVKGGWYHYDCGPRKAGGRFCMVTDSQLTQYSKTHGNKYIWNYSAIPKSATKKLTKIY